MTKCSQVAPSSSHYIAAMDIPARERPRKQSFIFGRGNSRAEPYSFLQTVGTDCYKFSANVLLQRRKLGGMMAGSDEGTGTTRKRGRGARRSSRTPAARTTEATLTCPECSRTFTRAAALGAHRRRAHGVAGSSRRRTSTSLRRARAAGPASSATRRAARSGTNGATARSQGFSSGPVDRDALLQALFPSGVPARAEALSAVGAWLEEAERLAGMT